MPKNQLFFDDIFEEMVNIYSKRYGEISEIGRVNYEAKRYFRYNILRNKVKEDKRSIEIIEEYINTHNDNNIKYNKELGGFTYVIPEDVIHNIALILAPFYQEEYFSLKRNANSNNIVSKKCISEIYENKVLLNYVCLLYKELIEDNYNEEDEEYIKLALKVLLYKLDRLSKLSDFKLLKMQERREKIAKEALVELMPFFSKIYRDILTSDVILDYITFMVKNDKVYNSVMHIDFKIFSDIYYDLD